jgi:hypothetical protein
MNKIYLRYGNYTDGVVVWSSYKDFSPPVMRQFTQNNKITGNDLRDIAFSHVKSRRTQNYEIVLSANDLANDSNYNFIVALYNADIVQYNFNAANSLSWVSVLIDENGKMPLEYLNNHKKLRKLKLTLIQIYPD